MLRTCTWLCSAPKCSETYTNVLCAAVWFQSNRCGRTQGQLRTVQLYWIGSVNLRHILSLLDKIYSSFRIGILVWTCYFCLQSVAWEIQAWKRFFFRRVSIALDTISLLQNAIRVHDNKLLRTMDSFLNLYFLYVCNDIKFNQVILISLNIHMYRFINS